MRIHLYSQFTHFSHFLGNDDEDIGLKSLPTKTSIREQQQKNTTNWDRFIIQQQHKMRERKSAQSLRHSIDALWPGFVEPFLLSTFVQRFVSLFVSVHFKAFNGSCFPLNVSKIRITAKAFLYFSLTKFIR